MASIRGSMDHRLVTPVTLRVRPVTLAVGAMLVAALVVVAIAIAVSGGGTDGSSGFTKSVRVAPAGQSVPTPDERNQQPGLNGPGMRP
jgi:hypothetical protein